MGRLIKVNAASGTDLRPPPWVNLDLCKRWPSNPRDCDIVWDARSDKLPFPDATADEFVGGYLLLHVALPHHEPLIREAFRVLAPGGRIELGEVDMDVAMRRWLANPQEESAHQMIWGEHGSIHGPEFEEFDRHVSGHTEGTLRALLAKCGFVQIERFKQHAESVWYELSMQARKP